MDKRLLMLGVALILNGCSLFQNQNPLPPPQMTCKEILDPDPTGFHEPYLKVAQRVPGFGGLFLNEQDNSVLYVYLTDLSQEEAVKQAIMEVFGPRWAELHMLPRELRMLQGQYSYPQLMEWSSCISRLLVVPGITAVGINMSKNRVSIGLEKMKRSVVEAIEDALDRLGIPREAVILEEIPRAVPK